MASISINNLANAIYESSLGKEGNSLNDILAKSVIFIRDKNLIGKKEEILHALENIVNKKEGIIKAKVITKSKVDKNVEREIEEFIKDKYKAKEVHLELKVENEVLGGIRIEVEDNIIDMTLSNKLHQLQNYLITN